jgi:hypothetical protein
MAPRFEKITTPHQQNQVLAQTKPNLLFKSGERRLWQETSDSRSKSALERIAIWISPAPQPP